MFIKVLIRSHVRIFETRYSSKGDLLSILRCVLMVLRFLSVVFGSTIGQFILT